MNLTLKCGEFEYTIKDIKPLVGIFSARCPQCDKYTYKLYAELNSQPLLLCNDCLQKQVQERFVDIISVVKSESKIGSSRVCTENGVKQEESSNQRQVQKLLENTNPTHYLDIINHVVNQHFEKLRNMLYQPEEPTFRRSIIRKP